MLAAAIVATLLGWVVFRVIARLPAAGARPPARSAPPRTCSTSRTTWIPTAITSAGPRRAPVTLVEYGDYQCPYCGQAEVVIRELLDEFGDELRYVWRHLPLSDVHPNAQMAAEAAEAAARPGGVLGDARHAARPPGRADAA